MKNTVGDIQGILFHLHSMGELLINHHRELIDSGKMRYDPGDISEPLLTIADLIKEKTEACLEKLELLEVHFGEVDPTAETKPAIVR